VSLHYSQQLWGDDVEEFKPSRFLGEYLKRSAVALAE
jgi:hypothetical protein